MLKVKMAAHCDYCNVSSDFEVQVVGAVDFSATTIELSSTAARLPNGWQHNTGYGADIEHMCPQCVEKYKKF